MAAEIPEAQNVPPPKTEASERNDKKETEAAQVDTQINRADPAVQILNQEADKTTDFLTGITRVSEGKDPNTGKPIEIQKNDNPDFLTGITRASEGKNPDTGEEVKPSSSVDLGPASPTVLEEVATPESAEAKEAPKTKGDKIIQDISEQLKIIKNKNATSEQRFSAAMTIFAKFSELMTAVKNGSFGEDIDTPENSKDIATNTSTDKSSEDKDTPKAVETLKDESPETPDNRRERLKIEIKDKGSIDVAIRDKNGSIETEKMRVNGEINAIEGEEKALEKKISDGNQAVRDLGQKLATADNKTKDNIGYELKMATAEVESDQRQIDIAKTRRSELIQELTTIEDGVKQDIDELSKMKTEFAEKVNMTKQGLEIAKQIDIPEIKDLLSKMTVESNEKDLSISINMSSEGVSKITEIATANGVDISALGIGPDSPVVKNPEDLMKVMQQIVEKLKFKQDEEAKKKESQATPQETPAQTQTPDFLEGMNRVAGVQDPKVAAEPNTPPETKKSTPPEPITVAKDSDLGPGYPQFAAAQGEVKPAVESVPQTKEISPANATDNARQTVESLRAQLSNPEDKAQTMRELKDAIAVYERAYASEIASNPTYERQAQIVQYLGEIGELKKTLG